MVIWANCVDTNLQGLHSFSSNLFGYFCWVFEQVISIGEEISHEWEADFHNFVTNEPFSLKDPAIGQKLAFSF